MYYASQNDGTTLQLFARPYYDPHVHNSVPAHQCLPIDLCPNATKLTRMRTGFGTFFRQIIFAVTNIAPFGRFSVPRFGAKVGLILRNG